MEALAVVASAATPITAAALKDQDAFLSSSATLSSSSLKAASTSSSVPSARPTTQASTTTGDANNNHNPRYVYLEDSYTNAGCLSDILGGSAPVDWSRLITVEERKYIRDKIKTAFQKKAPTYEDLLEACSAIEEVRINAPFVEALLSQLTTSFLLSAGVCFRIRTVPPGLHQGRCTIRKEST